MASAGDVNGDGTDDLIVGSRDWSSPSTPNLGRAYLFFGECGGTLAASPSWIAEGVPIEGWGSGLGADVGAAGDVNGDGFGDIFVLERDWWAPGSLACDPADLTPCASGRISVWYGGPTGPAADATGRALAPDWSWAPSSWEEWIDAVTAGDVNGNAIGDLVVAVPDFGADHVRIFLGVAVAGLPPNSNQTLEDPDNQLQSEFGQTMALGDVDGDGKDDLLVGAFGAWNPGTSADHAGVAYLFSGTASGVTPTPVWTRWGTANYEKYGGAVAIPGDMDGDGYADMVISAPASYEHWHPAPLIDPRVEFFRGGDYGPEDEPDSTLVEESWHLAPAGDVDGSAALGLVPRADLAMERRPRGPDGFAIGQEALVVHGSPSLVGDITLVRDLVGGAEPVAGAGDVNADGFDDVAVGDAVYFEPPAGETTGRAWLHPGQSSAFGAVPPEPARCCPHPTEDELAWLRVEGVTFSGAGYVEVHQDTGEPYPLPHWFDGGLDGSDVIPGADRRAPGAYVRGSRVELQLTLRFDPAKPQPTVEDGCLHVQGLEPSGARFEGVVTQQPDGTFGGVMVLLGLLPNFVDVISEYKVRWQASRDGTAWIDIGTSRARVYVTLASPDSSLAVRNESVLDIACRNAVGCMTRECAVEKVYEEFRSFSDGLPRKALDGLLIEDGVRMQYWADVGTSLAAEVDANAMGPGDVTRLDGILDPNPTSPNLNGIGTCGAWQALFMACLQVHGVPRAPYRLVPDDGGLHPVLVRSLFSTTGLIVKDHAFGDALVEPLCTRPDVFEGIELLPLVFTHLEVDCATGAPSLGQSCDGPGVMGQNRGTSANPRSIFWEHAMVCYAGRLYDPSYGTADVAYPFTESQLRDWEHERLAGYFTHECPGAGRSTTEEAAARNETAFGVIPP